MSLPAFNSENLLNRLQKMENKRQLAFGAACCLRLTPNYLAFNIDTKWGEVTSVNEALEAIWSFLNGTELTEEKINELIVSCENAAPDSEDFNSLYVSFAQDACFAICSVLDFILDNNVENIVKAATYATDSVDLYVQEIENLASNDSNLEQKILNHKLMQRELRKQQDDLISLEQSVKFDVVFLKELKESWNNNGKSNLDLP